MHGSGRGNKDQAVIDDPYRPDCPVCGGFMESSGKDWHCKKCGKYLRKNPKRIPKDFYVRWGFDTDKAEKHARRCEKKKRLIVTSAQNNTPVDKAFWLALKQCARYYNCEIAVIPSHYKNVTLFDKEPKSWVDELSSYLVHTDIEFGNVLIRSDVKINATTLWPLSGKQAHGGNHWVVFGHPQIACEPVATPSDMLPKRLYTTGSCTLPNYSISDSGEKAKFHHCAGALIIEKQKDFCFVRQINADERGHFYDLDVKFTQNGHTKGHRALSLTTGDEHVKFNIVSEETYTKRGSIVKTLKPKYIVRHDVLDGYAGSHHHEKDPMLQYVKHTQGDNDYAAELDEVVDFINNTTPEDSITLIVPSNHHDHLKKFLDKADANNDHLNAHFILDMQKAMREAADKGENYDPFYLYLKDRLKCKFEFLDRNTPYLLGDVDHSQHGDVGTNGSRGGARAMARTTFKMTIGHSHGARICQGVFQTGVSTGRLEYERGLSDHSNTHVLLYPNGKRTLIDIIDGKWKA